MSETTLIAEPTAATRIKRSGKKKRADSRQTDLFSSDTGLDTDPTEQQISDYEKIISHAFRSKYKPGITKFRVTSADLKKACEAQGLSPRNPADPVYTYRFRRDFPSFIRATETLRDPNGRKLEWMILPDGDGKYLFTMGRNRIIPHTLDMEPVRVRQKPTILSKPPKDEQAKLVWIQKHGIVEDFLGLPETELVQNHKRTKVDGIGQIEIDEMREAIGHDGERYIITIQAKTGINDRLASAQILSDIEYARLEYPNSTPLPLAVKFLESPITGNNTIILYLLKKAEDGFIDVVKEQHYTIVDQDKSNSTDGLVNLWAGRPGSSNKIELL